MAVDADDFIRPEDEAGRFDHAYLGRLMILRWGLGVAYLALVVTGILPVRDAPFVFSLAWFSLTNLLFTWSWIQKRPVEWHDRFYIYFDLITVVAVMITVADMTYPIWLCLVLLMLAASAEQPAVTARVFNASCVFSLVGTAVFLYAIGWDSPNAGLMTVTSVILGFIAYDVSITFEGNRRLRRYIRRLTVTDPLTQIANRRSLSRLLASTPDINHSLAVAIMDVDKFKQYNDEYGHLAGDKLLRRIAEILTEDFPQAVMISRYGGDEFVMILTGDSADESARTIYRALNERDDGAIAVSVGAAIWPNEQPTLDAALALADDRLRAAKRSRRSRKVAKAASGY